MQALRAALLALTTHVPAEHWPAKPLAAVQVPGLGSHVPALLHTSHCESHTMLLAALRQPGRGAGAVTVTGLGLGTVGVVCAASTHVPLAAQRPASPRLDLHGLPMSRVAATHTPFLHTCAEQRGNGLGDQGDAAAGCRSCAPGSAGPTAAHGMAASPSHARLLPTWHSPQDAAMVAVVAAGGLQGAAHATRGLEPSAASRWDGGDRSAP